MSQIFLAIIFFGFYQIQAQQVMRSDTISGNVLTMSMDQKISDLLSATEDKCATNIKSNDSFYGANNDNPYTPAKIIIPKESLSNAEICRRNPRLMGFKIQIAVVKSNEEAKEVGLYFRRRFPSTKVEVDASLRPNYKVLAGSYLTKSSANSDFNSVRKSFKDARLIPYRVFCVEAK